MRTDSLTWCHSVVSLQPDVFAFQIASLVDVADRGKPTLSGIAGCKFCFCFCCGPLRLGSVVRTSLQNLASAAGMCLWGFENSGCVRVALMFDV